ncbi:two-component regulator propeller domain-containing protein [Rubrivirga sp. IMCC43871]|uniref:two-component regulator propeller domain-containing protein n=1 Tax=Rubrivirga sp. IMCC43871 TaxID=3391575 RepID=UPI00398FCF4A
MLVGVLVALAATAQPAPSLGLLDPAKAPSQYGADAWGTEDGLPQSRVEAITQSSEGYLWIGTQEGLARFDGVRFTRVPQGAGGLPNTDIRALAPARGGGVWVGMRRGGLAHVDAQLRVRVWGEAEGLVSEAVASLAVGPEGRVWVGTRNGLCQLAPGARRLACLGTDAGLPDPYVRSLLVLDGEVWAGTRGGLAVLRDGEVQRLDGLGGVAREPVNALVAGSGGVWVGTSSGLALVRDRRLVARPEADATAGLEIDALAVDTSGSLWVGTFGGGLVRLRGADRAELAAAAGADASTVLALLQDREGSLWVGTGGSGLLRLRNTKFTPVAAREGLPSDRAYAIAADPTRGVWVGTTGGLAQVVGGRVVLALGAQDGLLGNDVSAVYATRDGTVWAAVAGEGVCRVRGGAVAGCLTAGAGLPDPYATAFLQDQSGTLWLGTDAGLSRWDGSAFVPLADASAPQAPVTALAEGPDGRLWIGTYGAGLLVRNGDTLRAVEGTAGDNILTLHARGDGVWAGTDGSGLLFLPSPQRRVARVTTTQGLPSDIVPQILEDGQGRLWMTSNQGVYVITARAAEAAARSGRALRVTLFTRADGLPATEANGGSQPAGARASDGTLYFPTAGGVGAIDPSRIPTNGRAPGVVIEGMTVDGEPVSLPEGRVVLAPGATEFSFSYAGLSYLTPERVRHRFRLDGRDTRWTEAEERREAFYTDLAPGDYTFRVQASNGDGVWSETDATLSLRLQPHFWQTAWFAVLAALVVAGLIVAAFRARTAQLLARQRQLEETVASRTLELANEKAETERLNAEFKGFNDTLQVRVREQLEEIVRGSRLQKYFPKKVVARILDQEGDVEVAAERRVVTIVFTDLAGFTRLSEATPPDRVTALLNDYLNEMVALIDAHGGTLDKVMGDGIMVLFGAADEMAPRRQAQQALAMAAGMQRAMVGLTTRWHGSGIEQPVALRVGVHQGEVTVGNFGTDELVEFTAIGHGVNLAARLEGACAPGGVLVSAQVRSLAEDGVAFEAPRSLRLKGIEDEVEAFPLAF